MNIFARNGQESIKQQTAEPIATRRAVRYAAADNAQAALQRQFPGTAFIFQQVVNQQTVGQQAMQQNVGVQDDFAQAA